MNSRDIAAAHRESVRFRPIGEIVLFEARTPDLHEWLPTGACSCRIARAVVLGGADEKRLRGLGGAGSN